MTAQESMSQAISSELAARGMTKNALADALGINRRNLQQRFNNKVSWSLMEIDRTADFLGISPWQLLSLGAMRNRLATRGDLVQALADALEKEKNQ